MPTAFEQSFLGNPKTLQTDHANTCLLVAPFDQTVFDQTLFKTHKIQRPDNLRTAVEKRQADFLAGRLITARAFEQLSLPATNISIGQNRNPIWPQGVVGSISHTKDMCGCLVSTHSNLLVGIDIEAKMKPQSLRAARAKALNQVERDLIDGQNHMDPDTLTALVFSGKETLFKALHPIVQRFFGFDSAELSGSLDADAFKLRLTQDLHPSLKADDQFHIQYRVLDDHVLTWLVHEPA